MHTPIGDIGVALCWEMVRYDTLRRLSQKVDLVLAGTCWADLPDWEGGAQLKQYNREFAQKTPVRFAGLLHAPVIYSNHCGQIAAYDFPDDKYWIEDLPSSYIYAWENHNAAGKKYYDSIARPYYVSRYKV